VRLREYASLQKIRAAVGTLHALGVAQHLASYRLVTGRAGNIRLVTEKEAGYHVTITRGHNQLSDPRECDAIKKSGLHHVRYAQRREGAQGLALALGAIIAAMPMVIDELAAPTARGSSRSQVSTPPRPACRCCRRSAAGAWPMCASCAVTAAAAEGHPQPRAVPV
jgi:hypothetical protein